MLIVDQYGHLVGRVVNDSIRRSLTADLLGSATTFLGVPFRHVLHDGERALQVNMNQVSRLANSPYIELAPPQHHGCRCTCAGVQRVASGMSMRTMRRLLDLGG